MAHAGEGPDSRVRQIYDICDVGVLTGAGMMLKRVWLGTDSAGSYRNDVPFEVVSRDKPARAMLDPAGNLLKYEEAPVKIQRRAGPQTD